MTVTHRKTPSSEPHRHKAPAFEPLWTMSQVADYLQLPVETVRSWRKVGQGPVGHKVGRHVRYRRADVEAWFAELADRVEGQLGDGPTSRGGAS